MDIPRDRISVVKAGIDSLRPGGPYFLRGINRFRGSSLGYPATG